MKINITNKQYEDLITALALANGMLGILGDLTTDEEGKGYKERSNRTEELESFFLQHAALSGNKKLAHEYGGKMVLDDEAYENDIFPIIEDYDEHVLYDSLSSRLAWRDFHREHTKEEIDAIGKKNGGYFGVAMYDYEKKYWDEFEKHDLNRLEIVENEKIEKMNKLKDKKE